MTTLSASIDFKSSSDRSVLLDVTVRNEPVLSGLWTFDVRLGQKGLRPESGWSTICEHTERGCEYIEIELHLSEDYRFQRSLLLDHNDKLLLLVDTVLTDEKRKTKRTL